MTTALWILAAFMSLLLVFNRRKVLKHVFRFFAPREAMEHWDALATQEDVAKLSATTADAVVDRVLARVAQEAEAHYINTLSKLRAEVIALRNQLAEMRSEWVTVGVHVRGFKVNDEDKHNYYALIQVHRRTQELRAHPQSEMRVLAPSVTACEGTEKEKELRPSHKSYKFSSLGAPWYGRVQGDPHSISMLGETYSNRGY